MIWQSFLNSIENALDSLESAVSTLMPESASAQQVGLYTGGAFLAIALLIFVFGSLIMGRGRNRPPEQMLGSKRPLVFGILTEPFAGMIPLTASRRDVLKKELVQAGYYHRKALEEFLALRNVAIFAWILFVGMIVISLATPTDNLTENLLIGGGIVSVAIFAFPRLILGSQAKARVERIQFSLPDALDMVSMTVASGLPMRQAITRVGQELKPTHPDIACELALVDHQTQAGSIEQALRQFAKRVDIADVSALATTVMHADRLGGNVGTAFNDFADGIRESRRQRAEESGNKTSVKLLFPIIFFLAPPIYILLLGPAVLELKDFVQREQTPGRTLSRDTGQAISASVERPTRRP